MSYATIAQCATDPAFFERVTAACAQEGASSPLGAASAVVWAVSAAGDIEAAYASALASNNPNPGGDETVITDGMILSAVQAEGPPS